MGLAKGSCSKCWFRKCNISFPQSQMPLFYLEFEGSWTWTLRDYCVGLKERQELNMDERHTLQYWGWCLPARYASAAFFVQRFAKMMPWPIVLGFCPTHPFSCQDSSNVDVNPRERLLSKAFTLSPLEKATVEMMIWQCGSSLISHIVSSLYSGGLMLWYIRVRMSLFVPSGWSHQIWAYTRETWSSVRQCMIVFLPVTRYGSKSGNFLPFSPQVMNWTVNWVFGHSLDLLRNFKLLSKKPKLLQTEIVDEPGLRVAVRPTTDMEAGNQPHKKVPIVVKAVRNERPQKLIKWTLSMHPNKMLDRKVGLSVISLHSLSHKCSGSTQITCHLIHSFIRSDNQVPAFHASLRVSWQYEKAETFSFESSKT